MKGSIEVLIGISGSGKSTYAATRWSKDPLNTVIVNRDKIRELLFGYTEDTIHEYYTGGNIGKLEKQVTRYEDTLINESLQAGKHVIVDATHLKIAYIERYRYWNVPVDFISFDISVDEAMRRMENRNRKVSRDIVQRQSDSFDTLVKVLIDMPLDFSPVPFINDVTLEPAYIFDIDGTIAQMGDRSPYDWHKVGVDSVDYPTAYAMAMMYQLRKLETRNISHVKAPKVIICTGRDGASLEATEAWLETNKIDYDEIYIREKGDMRADWIVKEEMWRDIAERNHIVAMFDDRLQVVRRARALGLKVFNVEYNNF